MKIYAISDIHGDLPPQCPPCDLLIIAGDICPHTPHTMPVAEYQAHWLNRDFRRWLKNQPAKEIIGTWGNHDFVGKYGGLIPSDLPIEIGVDKLIEIGGLKIYLSPWVPNLGRWAFAYQDDVPEEIRQRIPDKVDILVSHGPPAGFFDGVIEGIHVGSDSLLRACERVKPPIIICGHIHEARGSGPTPWGGIIYNVASLDRLYQPYWGNRYMEIKCDSAEVHVVL